MIKRDCFKFVVQHDPNDPLYEDGADTSRSTGVLATFGSYLDKFIIQKHHVGNGILVRHPYQNEWSKPGNFSRDQLIPMLSGLTASGDVSILRKVFYAHLKRGFFCQNWDLTNPAVIGQMILGGEFRLLYPFLILSYLWHFLEILFVCWVKPFEECNQIMCQCRQFGTSKVFKWLHPLWETPVHNYWAQKPFRDQEEIAMIILEKF